MKPKGPSKGPSTKLRLMDRAKAILLQPGTTWRAIDAEFTKPVELYRGYIIPLAAIGPVCGLIGTVIFGAPVPFTFGLTRSVSISTALTQAIAGYVLALLSVFVIAQIINALAPTFSGQKNEVQALKVAAYSSTASWVGGVFALIPALVLVGLLMFLYSIYLLYAGLPVVMKAPDDQALAYRMVVIVAVIVVAILASTIVSAL